MYFPLPIRHDWGRRLVICIPLCCLSGGLTQAQKARGRSPSEADTPEGALLLRDEPELARLKVFNNYLLAASTHHVARWKDH